MWICAFISTALMMVSSGFRAFVLVVAAVGFLLSVFAIAFGGRA